MTRTHRISVATASTVLALCALTACSSSSDEPTASSSKTSSSATPSSASASSPPASTSSTAAAAEPAVITIKEFKYSGTSSVKAGTKITVNNDDSEAHTVTADKGDAFDVKIDPGKSATFTAPDTAGSYAFHCTYHGNMTGTLKVT